MNITKRQVREAVGKRDADVARFFGITPGAVAQWPDDEPLPEGRQWQARALRPDLFPTSDVFGPAPSREGGAADAAPVDEVA